MKLHLGLNGEKFSFEICGTFDGVGLIRGEYLCRQANAWVLDPACQQHIADYVSNVARAFAGKPVWYRLIDMESSEVNTLRGCDVAIHEKTTLLGLRGLRRGLLHRCALEAELRMLRSVCEEHSNVHVLLPFVAEAGEVEAFLEVARDVGLVANFGVMAEIPSLILTLPSVLDLGIAHVTLGMNDLTSLVMGTARGTTLYRQNHSAVLALVREAVVVSRRREVALSAAGYLSSSLLETLEEAGVERAVVHYSQLPAIWPDRYLSLDGVVDLMQVKRSIREKLNEPLL